MVAGVYTASNVEGRMQLNAVGIWGFGVTEFAVSSTKSAQFQAVKK